MVSTIYANKQCSNNDLVLIIYVGKYIGSRPVRLKKSTWKDRSFLDVKKKEKEKRKAGLK